MQDVRAASYDHAATSGDDVFVFPASFGQERLWFLERLQPEVELYASWQGMRLRGQIVVDVLERAVAAVVDRHEALRTTLRRSEGELVQVVAARLDVRPAVVDIAGDLAEAARAAAAEPFDLATGPLVRLVLLRGAAEQVLLIGMHHTVCDERSFDVLWRDLDAAYQAVAAGATPPFDEPGIAYADYAVWQREWLQGADGSGAGLQGAGLQTQLGYWRDRLAGAPPLLTLPTDRPRPPVSSPGGASVAFRIDRDVTERLRTLAQERRATLFMVLMAGYQAFLARYSGQTDVAVGTPVAGRNRPELEDVVGFFVNTLVLRTNLSGRPSFAELVDHVRDGALDAYAHADVPFERVVAELAPERDPGHTPLYQAMLVHHGAGAGARSFAGMDAELVSIPTSVATFDLTLELTEDGDGLGGVLEYRTDLFSEATAQRMMGNVATLLAAAAADPATPWTDLPLLTPAESEQLLVTWNDTAVERPPALVSDLVAARAAENPSAVAVASTTSPRSVGTPGDGRSLSYAEFDAAANRLARHLRELGADREQIVGVALDRGVDLPVALLGVVRSGAAFLPLDITHPPARLGEILADAGAAIVVADEAGAAALPVLDALVVALDGGDASRIAAQASTAPDAATRGGDAAYVIYTSGSTGTPKGVVITHGGFADRMLAMSAAWHIDPSSRVLQFAPPGFDAATFEIFTTLVTGATLVTAPREALLPGPGLVAVLRDQAVTTVTLPPSILAAVPDDDLPSLRTLAVAGEACPAEVVARWAPGRTFVNGYGPTEVTVCATVAYCEPGEESPPIGRPIANTRVYVLDPRLQPLPVGVPGELCVGGSGLARGYHNRPELTAEAFVDHPSFGRLYRTGDRARWRPDGQLEFLGRLDDQVKVRGVRIEPAEVETVLLRDEAVEAAVVVVREDRPGDREMVAYLTPAVGAELDPDVPRATAQAALPPSLVPSAFVVLDEFPLTPNGKIDRAALPAPARVPRPGAQPPRTPTERAVAKAWAETLRTDAVGTADKFFDVGGNSLRIADLFDRLEGQFPHTLALVELFEHTTVAAQAAAIDRRLAPAAEPEPAVATYEL